MREARTAQQSLLQPSVNHEIAHELTHMSDWLDAHPELLEHIAADLRGVGTSPRGRRGLTIDSILRCALLKQYRQVDYRSLAFHLRDSVSFFAFARLDPGVAPSKSSLQSVISAIQPATWETLTRGLLDDARTRGIESGETVRIDATVTDTAILAPSDSHLLYDSVRVGVRLLKQAQALTGRRLPFSNHTKRAKRRAHAIMNAKTNERRRPLYVELLGVTDKTLQALLGARKTLKKPQYLESWRAEVDHYLPLIERVMDQATRRVIYGERVPAGEKLVSLFEPHTAIIVKGRRDVQYGHKLTLTGGVSGLVLDVVIEDGNPADTTSLQPMIARHIGHYNQPPRDLAADGGYASRATLAAAKAAGVKNMAFRKRAGLAVEDMTDDRWLYRKLCNFRAGIEGVISLLKRKFGLSRCNWKGFTHFKAYVHSAVFTHNLVVLTKRLAAPG